MHALDGKIKKEAGIEPSPAWLEVLKKTHDATIELLEELKGRGFDYKTIDEVALTESDGPAWVPKTKRSGIVKIRPAKDCARALAHELGHGFHEVWRETSNHRCCGEAMAEAIRWFVEERMRGREWQPQRHRTCVLEACAWNWDTFKNELNGKIAELAKED